MSCTLLKKTGIIMVILFLCIPLFLGAQVSVEPDDNIQEDYCHVYFYPHIVNQEDRLEDGSGSFGTPIRIEGNTLLVWVDLEPEMRFTHPTKYILISNKGVRIIDGGWWPVLNGKKILYGEMEKYAILTPFSIDNGNYDNINIYIYPHELYPFDELVDGPTGDEFKIIDNTLLIWVDLLPRAFFTHPTAYILIAKEYTRVEKGGWWPVLNGRRILFGDMNKLGVISPFTLLAQHIDTGK
ncbi:MAG: hypothetical protein JXB88_25610 [Spirochaetales bacterium]|nr:hypothetical protein [Spirochaetales bacterium]